MNLNSIIPGPTCVLAVARYVSEWLRKVQSIKVVLEGAKHLFSLCEKRDFAPVRTVSSFVGWYVYYISLYRLVRIFCPPFASMCKIVLFYLCRLCLIPPRPWYHWKSEKLSLFQVPLVLGVTLLSIQDKLAESDGISLSN